MKCVACYCASTLPKDIGGIVCGILVMIMNTKGVHPMLVIDGMLHSLCPKHTALFHQAVTEMDGLSDEEN